MWDKISKIGGWWRYSPNPETGSSSYSYVIRQLEDREVSAPGFWGVGIAMGWEASGNLCFHIRERWVNRNLNNLKSPLPKIGRGLEFMPVEIYSSDCF